MDHVLAVTAQHIYCTKYVHISTKKGENVKIKPKILFLKNQPKLHLQT